MTTRKSGMFQPATRSRSKLRMTIDGPAGSGKSLTALRFAFALAEHYSLRVAAVDTEHGSLSKYEGDVYDGHPFHFSVTEPRSFSPDTYTSAINTAVQFGYGVLIIDSLTHAWNGVGGCLDRVDKSTAQNKFTAWKDVTPLHTSMVETILTAPIHIITTMRTKTEYVLEMDNRGRHIPRKIGTAPIQREGMEYEFDVICDVDIDHWVTVTKTRCSAIDGKRAQRPGANFMTPIINWLEGKPMENINVHGPCVEHQRHAIIEAAQAIGMPPDQLSVAIGKRYRADGSVCEKLFDLTFTQAEEMLANLKGLVHDSEPTPF